MTNKELSADLKKRAIALGLCRQWQRDWTTNNSNDCRFTVEQMRIKHIMFSQKSLMRFICLVKENINYEGIGVLTR